MHLIIKVTSSLSVYNSRFDTVPACDRQTDGQTDGRIYDS